MSDPSLPPPVDPPPVPTASPSGYPASVAFALPDKVARWRIIGNIIMAIPHFIILYVLHIVAEILAIVAWFMGVITGKIPVGFLTFFAMVVRYQARIATYASFVNEDYPPFAFTSALDDPGDYPNVTVDFVAHSENRNRVTIFFRFILAIPQLFALLIMNVIAYFVYIIGWFAVLITGSWPFALRTFIVGLIRWNTRVSAYLYLLTDEYPPFGLTE